MDKERMKQNLFSLKDVHFSYAWGGGKVEVLRGIQASVFEAARI